MCPLSRLVVVAGNTPHDRQPIVVQAVEHSFLREDVRVRLPHVGLSNSNSNNQPKGRDDELYICAHGVRKRSMGAGQTAEFFADRRSERPNDSSEA